MKWLFFLGLIFLFFGCATNKYFLESEKYNFIANDGAICKEIEYVSIMPWNYSVKLFSCNSGLEYVQDNYTVICVEKCDGVKE